MHRRDLLVMLPAAPFLICAGRGGPEDDDQQVALAIAAAVEFCKGYSQTVAAQGNPLAFVRESKLVTQGFKTAYEAHFEKKKPGTRDPILSGQGTSNLSLRITSIVSVKSAKKIEGYDFRFSLGGNGSNEFPIYVRFNSGKWQVDGTRDLRNKSASER